MVFDYHFIFLSLFFIFTLPLSDFETICESVRAHISYMPRFPQSWFGSFKWNVYMKFRNFHWNFNCLIKYLNTFCSALLPHLILLSFFQNYIVPFCRCNAFSICWICSIQYQCMIFFHKISIKHFQQAIRMFSTWHDDDKDNNNQRSGNSERNEIIASIQLERSSKFYKYDHLKIDSQMNQSVIVWWLLFALLSRK